MRNDEKFGERFIQILEIIYAIIFACGAAEMIEKIFMEKSNNIHPFLIGTSVIVAILVLIRFFFAPSKNVKVLVKKSDKKGRKWIMPGDIIVLIAHSVLFYLMCLKIKKLESFYFLFFILLLLNAIWLFIIRVRLRKLGVKKETISYMKIWSENNIICVAIYFLSLVFYHCNPFFSVPILIIGMFWFILALVNSVWDLFKTYDAYFTAD